ncbi:MAG: hypothetical protein HGN29_11205 [Asgard group archaeon]|nr:hypothetical protein [Asgard group archaeon]
MKNKYFTLLLVSITCLLLTLGSISAFPPRTDSAEVHSVEVLDAYYVGADIYTSIAICVQTQSSTENYYLQLSLINPLREIENLILHIITSYDSIILDIVFYGYATVAGDYTIEATIISNDNGWFALTDIIIFDPPSGGSEGDPYIGISIR